MSKDWIEFGPFRVDLQRRTLERNGEPIAISSKAFEILAVLLKQPGQIVDKETLMREVWPGTIVEENNLTVNISGLRKALGEASGKPTYILTVPGRGYRFIASLKSSRSRARTFAIIAIAAGLIIAVLVLRVADTKPKYSIAVLPFRVLNSNSSIEYLGVGLADSLITRLSSARDIKVRPLSSSLHVADKDPVEAGRALSAETVLTGTLQVDDVHARVNMQMIRIKDRSAMWSATFEEQMAEPFVLEDKISMRVATSLIPHLSKDQDSGLAKHYTQNHEAWQNYLRGRYYASRYTEEGFRKALAYFQRAIEQDPSYALAYSGLADCYYDASNILIPPREAMAKAKAAAQRSAELDPGIAEAHVSLGIVASKFDWDWLEAERQFQKALTLSPNSATAHLWYGLYRAQTGDLNGAVQHVKTAAELDPLSSDAGSYLATTLYWDRRYPESLAQAQKQIEFDPNFFPAYVSRAWALEAQNNYGEALKSCEQAHSLSGAPWVRAALARAEALAGNKEQAEKILNGLTAAANRFVSGYDLATVYAALDQKDQAFKSLNDAYDGRAEWLSYIRIDPQLDSLRKDPRYKALLQRMKLSD